MLQSVAGSDAVVSNPASGSVRHGVCDIMSWSCCHLIGLSLAVDEEFVEQFRVTFVFCSVKTFFGEFVINACESTVITSNNNVVTNQDSVAHSIR